MDDDIAGRLIQVTLELTHRLEDCFAADGRVFAIGDVHGELDLFEAALSFIEARHREEEEGPATTLVYLGDLIDRGPSSLAVLDRAERGIAGLPQIYLAGNHEQMLLYALADDEHAATMWIQNGGTTVLNEAGWPSVVEDAFGDGRLAFLRSVQPHFQSGGCLFVHAGLSPFRSLAKSLGEQVFQCDRLINLDRRTSNFWVRKPFLELSERLEGWPFVIHGHTPAHNFEIPAQTGHRVGIDLGSGRTGAIGVAELSGANAWFYRVARHGPLDG